MRAAEHRPSLAFVEALRRRLRPEHRVVSDRLRLLLGLAWALALIGPAVLLLICGVLAMTDAPRQLVFDTLASVGLGAPRPEARLGGIYCSYHRGTGRLELNEHRCAVRVQDGGDILRLDVRATEPLERWDAGPVVTIFGQPAVPWTASVMWGRWLQMLPLALPFVLLVPLSCGAVLAIRSNTRRIRVILAGEPQLADLLCRRAGKGKDAPVRWDIAFEHGGRRRFARVEAHAAPIVLDRPATRGIVLATPDGSVEVLEAGGWPLTLDEATATWLTERSEAMRQSDRPPATGLTAFAGSLPEGPERDYAQAYGRLLRADMSDDFRAAFDDLHAAAARIDRARLDALLQDLRASCEGPLSWMP